MNDTTDVAKGMMNIAEQRLLFNYPFHGRFVASWRVEAADFLSTMGVTVQNGKILLFFNPAFVTNCTLPELESVLLHEVGHVLFEHVLADPADFPDEWARMVAQEVSTNEWVAGPLPGNPITLAQYPFLPANEDTLTRYRKLVREGRRMPPESASCVPNHQRSGPKNSSSVPKSDSVVPKNDPPAPKKGASVPENGIPKPLDDHTLWASARESGQLSRMAIRVSIADAKASLTLAEWAKVGPTFRQQIDNLVANGPGAEEVQLMPGAAKINWRNLLRAFVRQAVTVEPTFQPRRDDFPGSSASSPAISIAPRAGSWE